MNITTNSNNKKSTTSPNLILRGLPEAASERLHCCYIRMKLKENNVFVNVTNLKGQTIIKYSSGIISTKGNKNKKRSRAAIQWIIDKTSAFVKANFDCTKIIINAESVRSATYLKEYKRKKLDIVYFQSKIPTIHNGCRLPKKRKI